MRTAIIAAVLLIASTARAEEHTAYVDIDRAITDCADGKKAVAELQAMRAEFDKAVAAAKAARKDSVHLGTAESVPLSKTAKAVVPSEADEQAREQRQRQAAVNVIAPRMQRILAKVAKAKRLVAIHALAGMAYVDPSLDLTAELVRRYDAGEGREPSASDAEIKALRDRLATLEAQQKPTHPVASPKPKL